MNRLTISLVLTLFLLAACGGGSSGNGNNNPPPRAGFNINASNGLQVSQVTYRSAASSGEIAGLAGNSGLTGHGDGSLAKPGLAQAPAGSVGSVLQKVPLGPVTLPCAVTGEVSISGDVDDPMTLTAGDRITVDYDNCDDGLGEVIDGTLDSLVEAFEGDVLSGIYDMTMAMDLINFQVTGATDVLMANGDGTATINSLASPYVEASVSGESMLSDLNGSTETLTNYASAQTVDAGVSPSPYTLSASGTLDSSQLDGSVTYSTPVMFEGEDANYPHVGEMLISGDASSARIIAQSNAIDVVIEIYDNTTGTGTPTDVINTTWTELAGS
jgi:hypothetical protein